MQARDEVLQERGKQLAQFHLPRWEELPEDMMLRERLIAFVENALAPLFPDEKILTGTMLQNYIKWGLAPKPAGRRYGRSHLAHGIVLSILKSLLPTKDISEGILLYTHITTLADAYDGFCLQLENALARASSFLFHRFNQEKPVRFEGFDVPPQRLAASMVCEALAFKIITGLLIRNQGFLGPMLSR